MALDDNMQRLFGAGVLPAMPNERNQRTNLMYFNTLPKTYMEKREINQDAVKLLQQIQNAPANVTNDSVLNINGTQVWRYLNPTSNAGTYDGVYRVDQQRLIENFMEFSRRATNLTSRYNRYFGLDIESLGDREGNFFMVSEISATGHTMKDGEYQESKRMVFNKLVAPDSKSQKELKRLINNFQSNPHNFEKLSPSLQRTLVDLVRYSTIAEEGMQGAVFGKNVIHSDVIGKVLVGKTIQNDELLGNAKNYVKHMRSGLANLIANGEDPYKVIEEYNAFVEHHKKSFFVTMNGENFDMPALQQWGKSLNVLEVAQPKYHMDYQKTLDAIARNPLTLHQMLGRPDGLRFEEGSTTLNEYRRTLGLSTDAAHAAAADTGMNGVGGVVAKSWKIADSMVHGSHVDFNKTKKIIGRRTPYLQYDNTPLTTNDILFGRRGLQNYKGHALDFQATFDKEAGTYQLLNPEINSTVINAESFYKPVRAYQIDDTEKGVTRHVLELMNYHEPDKRSFIVREGENAGYEIADFIHRHLEPTTGYTRSLNKKIYNLNLEDKARRRYEALFDTNGSATRGFEASKRMYKNAAAYQQRLNGQWKNIYEQATSQALENARKIQENTGKGVTPEQLAEMRYTAMGRLLSKRISHDEMIEMMDFNSKWDQATGTFVKNEEEEKQFFKMAPRMLSELPLYQEALKQIEENIEDPKQRDIAWSMFNQQVKETVGEHRSTRKRLPYESSEFKYYDKNTKKYITVNTSTVDDIIKKFNLYKDTGELSKEEKEALARERYKTLLASLNDSGVISKEKAKDLLDEHYHLNLSINDSVRQLALDLFEQKNEMLADIETTSLQSRAAVENLSADVANQIIGQSIKKAKGFQGYLLHEGNYVKPDLYQGELNEFFTALDKQHKLTQLNPNNRQAVESIMRHYMSIDPKLHASMQINSAGTEAILTMFNKEDAHTVLRHLRNGATEAHPKSFEVKVPLITRQGTISYGAKDMNASTKFKRVYDQASEEYKYVPVSSVEQLAERLTDTDMMTEEELMNYNRIVSNIKKGEFEEATKNTQRSIRETLDDLSGVKRDYGDNAAYEGTHADVLKQARVDPYTAMIQDYYEKGLLTEKDFSNKDMLEGGKLNPNVSVNDLWDSGKTKIRQNVVDWAQQNGIGDLYFSGVKAEAAVDGKLNRINAQDLLPGGYLTNQGRDNSVQKQNSRRITEAVGKRLDNAEVYTNQGYMTSTPTQRALDDRVGAKTDVHIKAAYLTQGDVDARIQAMWETPDGRELLIREGIMTKDGKHTVRYPSVYEQQMLLHDDLIKAFSMNDIKFKRGDDFEYNRVLIDEHGNFREGHQLKPGMTIGWRTKDGIKEEVKWEQKGIGHFISNPNDSTVAIRYEEPAVKFQMGIEKGTPSGGNRGYSKEFLEALTGVEGVGGVYNPNIAKHEDFGDAIVKTQLNKIHAHISAMSPEDQQIALDMFDKGKVGFKVKYLKDGSFVFDDNTKKLKRGVNSNNIYNLFNSLNKQFGSKYGSIAEEADLAIGNATFHTTWGIQGLSASSVVNYATIANEKNEAILSYQHDDDGNLTKIITKKGERKGVQYGPRELSMLREKGAMNTYNYVLGHILESANETGKLDESLGMVQSLGGLRYGPEAVDSDAAAHTLSIHDFERLPEEHSNKYSIKHTALDPDYIDQKLGGEAKGYWLELPKIHVDDREHPLQVTHNGQLVDKIFIPKTKIEGKGNEFWKNDLQKQIANIITQASNVAGDPKDKYKAHEGLQKAVNSYVNYMVKDVTSSSGITGGMLKANMPNSSSAMAKVMPISTSEALQGETVFISPDEAKALGVYEHILGGEESALYHHNLQKGFYIPDLRYPTFTEKAIQVAQLKIDPHAQVGYHNTSSLMASLLKEDSDGDYNHILAINDDAVQKELEGQYNQNLAAQEARQQAAYEKAIRQAQENPDEEIFIPKNRVQNEMQGEIEKDEGRRFTMRDLANDSGYFAPSAANSLGEIQAKTGKELIGRASNINFQMRQLAKQYIPDKKARQAIYDFGEGLEQDLTISSKHVKDGTIDLTERKGASDFLNAVVNGDYKALKEMDSNVFNGNFSEKYQLDEAIYQLQQIQTKVKADMMKDQALKMGTGSGMKLTDDNFNAIVDTIYGRNPEAVTTNEHASILQQILVDNGMTEPRQPISVPGEGEEVRPYDEPLNTIESTPAKKRLGNGFKGMVADFFEDATGGMLSPKTYDKVRETMTNVFDGAHGTRNKAIAAGAGIALAGLIGYNTLRNDPVMPYATPQQSQMESAQRSAPQPALGPVDGGRSGGATISISAKGKKQNQGSFSQMVGEGMQRSNYSDGNINMSVNYSDNTAQLNRIWYRDLVDQYS